MTGFGGGFQGGFDPRALNLFYSQLSHPGTDPREITDGTSNNLWLGPRRWGEGLKSLVTSSTPDEPGKTIVRDPLPAGVTVNTTINPAALPGFNFNRASEVAFSPDGRSLASGPDPTVRLWNLETGANGKSREAKELDAKKLKAVSEDDLGSMTWLLMNGYGPRSMLYQRPAFSGDWRLFGDLACYAPGMNTSLADIRAVVEAEAGPDLAGAPGQIDPAARALIDKARRASWQAGTIPGNGGRPAIQVVFDGAGRFALERVVSEGLRERVVCDGKHLWHLYPELALGARRAVSRFHREQLAALVPWTLPPAEDLAHGADLKCIGERTVALIPHAVQPAKGKAGKPAVSWQVHLTFAADGRLAQRRLVEMPSNKTHYRETYDDTGLVNYEIGADGKAKTEVKLTLHKAAEPDLKPDVKDLVIVPMPLRTRDSVVQAAGPRWNGDVTKLPADTAIALIATDSLTANGWTAHQIFGERFHAKDDRRLGFYVLLLGQGYHINPKQEWHWNKVKVRLDIAAEHPKEPLGKYLAFHNQILASGQQAECGPLGGPADGFVQRLAEFRNLSARCFSGRANQGTEEHRQAERARGLAFLRRCRSPQFQWAVLGLLQTYLSAGDARFNQDLADVYRRFRDRPGLAYVARYEQARSLLSAGRGEEALQAFKELHAQARKEGALPLIDASFLQAFTQQGDRGREEWAALMRKTAADLIADKQRPAVMALAWQCHELGDQSLANQLFATAFAGVPDRERPGISLLGIPYLWQTGQLARADALLQPLLEDKELAGRPALWRLAAVLAGRRGMVARSVACTEKALELEYQELPPVINLQAVRSEYGALLGHYQQLALASTMLDSRPPAEFVAKVVRAADRWRSLDTDATGPCQAAARVFQALGARDLAWDYFTTPLGQRPNEAAPWLNLAQAMSQEGDFDLADRAYAEAFAAEPTNAQILWDRALLLQQGGRTSQARELFRQIAAGKWQPRFNWIQAQARTYVNGF
jgi:tetratricopeptide (TPR) repeat protein